VRPGRATNHSPPSRAAVMEQQSYTSTHPLVHTGPATDHFTFYSFKYYIVSWNISAFYLTYLGDRSSTVVKVLCHKSEGRCFDPSWCH